VHACVHSCVRACVRVLAINEGRAGAHTCARMHTCKQACALTSLLACSSAYTHTHINTYIHKYMNTCMHTYMHTYLGHQLLHVHTPSAPLRRPPTPTSRPPSKGVSTSKWTVHGDKRGARGRGWRRIFLLYGIITKKQSASSPVGPVGPVGPDLIPYNKKIPALSKKGPQTWMGRSASLCRAACAPPRALPARVRAVCSPRRCVACRSHHRVPGRSTRDRE
jgi:hypothetical protein